MDEGAAQLRATLGIGGLFELVPDAVIVGDVTRGRVVLWNEAAEELFGYAADEALGMPLDLLVPAELKAAHLAGVARFAASNTGDLIATHRLVELPAVRRAGERIWVELRLARLGPADEPQYVVAVVRDVTARRLAQQEALEQAAQAQRAASAMREVVAMVSHDLRSPVAAIQGAQNILAKHWDQLDDAKRAEVLAAAQRQTAQVVALLDDLLDLSQIEAGGLRARPTDLDLGDVVNAAVATAAVPVNVDRSVAALRVHADAAQLQRVLVNLITNAARHGAPPITITAEHLDETVAVHVEDHGAGIDPTLLPRLFDAFTRAPDATSPGHGLGLAIVKGLLEAAGGTISYQPRTPGSRFTVSVPAPQG